MNAPPFVKNVVADLVEKRLWPLALALLVALIAIPVVLGGGGEEPVDETATFATAGAPAEVPPAEGLVSLATDAGSRGPAGALRDPFSAPGGATGGGSAAASGSTVTDRLRDALGLDGGGSTGGGSTGGGSTGGGSTGGVGGGGADLGPIDVVSPIGGGGDGGGDSPKPSLDSYAIDVRVGRTAQLRTVNDVVRLSPLPDARDPFLVFLGVLADGRTATFLVSDEARATGDGVCRPRPSSCERIEMQAGDTEFFDVEQEDGEVVQYQLDLRAVRRVRAASAAAAKAARSRESSQGRTMLRAALDRGDIDLNGMAYSPDFGLILPDGTSRQEEPGGVFGGYRTDLRFGEPGDQTVRRDLARLTPLPDPEDPAFLFLGVLDDGATALFLNPTGAAVSGDGTCRPDPATCTRVEVPSGAGVVFDVPMMDGGTVEYALDVDAISPIAVDTAAQAAASKSRESAAGRAILRSLLAEVGDLIADLSFDEESGTIVPAPPVG